MVVAQGNGIDRARNLIEALWNLIELIDRHDQEALRN